MSIFEPKGFPFPPENVEKKSEEESIFDFSYELEHVKFFDGFKNA
jgi:hypothetical protein